MQINRGWIALALGTAVIVYGVGSGWFHQLYMALLLITQDSQRVFHDEIAEKLRVIQTTHSTLATAGLALIGFLYGALHAVGPGHGKIIVSSYLLASTNGLRKGLVITLLSALLQACVAIALVFGVMALLGLTHAQTEHAAAKLESLSFGLIIVIGAALLGRGVKEIWRIARPAPLLAEPSCGCGHAHAPDPRRLEKIHDTASFLGMIVSIGIRPCSGAVLILLFSGLVGAYAAGILAVFAMALGTALTTGGLAVLTVQSKTLALRLTQTTDDKLRLLHAGLGIAGGAVIILLGTAFLSANTGLATSSDGMNAAAAHPLMRGLSPDQ
jgi:ABC-type nickel/cobalt efflux system permease component RcnA